MKFRDGQAPRVIGEGKDRLEIALLQTCYCEGEYVRITKREVQGRWTVYLQCETCGQNTFGGALKRDYFPNWQSFPEWNTELSDLWNEKYQKEWNERQERQQQEWVAEREAKNEALRQRRLDYYEWCRSSADWANLRGLVIQRAGGICEACLVKPATTAHHLTYQFGKLPPAWHLKAVCQSCHTNLHASINGREHEWDVDREQ